MHLAIVILLEFNNSMERKMTHFIISFRIKSDESYQQRYESFKSKVVAIAGSSGAVWDETSSFYILKAVNTAQGLCSDLYLGSDFNSTKDIMVVIDVDNRQKATKGPLEWPGVLESTLGF
jgi:hypothetical protein